MAQKALRDQILSTWRVNNEVNLKLIRGIPAKGFAAVPLASRGRDVAHQLTHLHKVRAGWLSFNGFTPKLEKFDRKYVPTRREFLAAFRTSGKAVERYLADRIDTGRRINFFKGEPVRWLAYMIAHESHHRGQIALALKQQGMRLPEKVALGDLWMTWYSGNV